MSSMYLALIDDEYGTLELSQDNGILVEEFEPGFPEVRASVINKPDRHGTIDSTKFFGSRVVTMSGKWRPTGSITRSQIRQRVLKYLMPDRRPLLQWRQDVGELLYQTTVRPDRVDWKLMSVVDEFSLALKVDPFWRDASEKTVSAPYAASVSASGDPWPWLGSSTPGTGYPGIDFADGYLSSGTLVNAGIAPAPVRVTVYGHAPDPVLMNMGTGEQLKFSGLNLLDGQILEVDMEARTAVVNGVTNAFGLIDFTVSTWWDVNPGSQYVSLGSGSAPSGTSPFAVFRWNDLYL